MSRTILSLVLNSLIFCCGQAFASEKANACLKYETEIGWSKAYSVAVTIIKGGELARATNDYAKYSMLSTYVVAFWDNDQATIFELPTASFGRIPTFPVEVVDQRQRKWQISQSYGQCL